MDTHTHQTPIMIACLRNSKDPLGPWKFGEKKKKRKTNFLLPCVWFKENHKGKYIWSKIW